MDIRPAIGVLALVLGAVPAATASAWAQAAPPKPDHVVIVIEENHSYSQIIGSASAPYINSLAGQGALFTAIAVEASHMPALATPARAVY